MIPVHKDRNGVEKPSPAFGVLVQFSAEVVKQMYPPFHHIVLSN